MNANRGVTKIRAFFYKNRSLSVLNANFLKKNTKIAKKTALITVNGTVRAVLKSKAKPAISCIKLSNFMLRYASRYRIN
jgi:hypothetical protein